MEKEILVDYDVVSEVAGHQKNTGVKLVEAAKDIFAKVKEKSMQLAVKGEFIQFNTLEELEQKLSLVAPTGVSIRVFDEVIGG